MCTLNSVFIITVALRFVHSRQQLFSIISHISGLKEFIFSERQHTSS
jgi:hypothetical protein